MKYVAGIRPHRKNTVRIEAERREERWIFHNYGHGGAGITLSWGSALECAEAILERVSPPAPLTVLGAGIIGLTTAHLLLERGFGVTVAAREFPPHTTSDIAGGLWAPACVATGNSPAEKNLYQRLVTRSREYFEGHPHPSVYPCPLFVNDPDSELNQTMGSGQPMEPGLGGQSWPTFLIETATYLPWLLDQVRSAGAHLVTREVEDFGEVAGSLVNCLGIGAGGPTGDRLLVPVRGQLVYLDSLEEQFAWEHPGGYLISRKDILVVGGTEEEGVTEPRPVPGDCKRILEKHRRWLATHPSPVKNLKQSFNNLAK